MNPILSRELRGRFRDRRSFLLLFGVCALLCLAAGFIYASATNFASGMGGNGASLTREAENRTGRELFRFLALGNTLAWLLIAPALTATGLAVERERGLLESLWLSPFRVSAQVWGRLGAALCFLAVLQVAIVPIYGIALLLGGVSLSDIGMAGVIIALAGCCGASFGLFCSARSYRGSSALGAAFFGVALWSVIAAYSASQLIWNTTPTNFLLTFSHPVAMLWLLLSPTSFASPFGVPTTVRASDALRFGLTFGFFSSLLLVWLAVRKAAKPLPDMKWSEGNTRLKKWRERVEDSKIARKERAEAARTRDAVAGALLYEVPVEKFVRFKNPLLAREVRGRFRLRQGGFLVSVGRFATLLIAISFWLAVAYNALDPVTRAGSGSLLMMGMCALGTLAIGVMSSSALVREREAGTWEGLHLSLLSPREIVRSKWLSPLVTLGYWTLPFWILLPLSLSLESVSAVFIVAASLGTVSAWGLWVSSRAPHSAAATSWTLITLLVAMLALPALDELVGVKETVAPLFLTPASDPNTANYGGNYYSGNYYRGRYYGGNSLGIDSDRWHAFEALWQSYHPFLSIGNLTNKITLDGTTRTGVVALSLALNALATTFLLWLVWKRLKKTEY